MARKIRITESGLMRASQDGILRSSDISYLPVMKNISGTTCSEFSIGKGSGRIRIRSNNGTAEFCNNGEEWTSFCKAGWISLESAPTPTTDGIAGQYGYFGGYKYTWTAGGVGTSTVIREVVETDW